MASDRQVTSFVLLRNLHFKIRVRIRHLPPPTSSVNENGKKVTCAPTLKNFRGVENCFNM